MTRLWTHFTREREAYLHLLVLLVVFSLLFVIRGAWQPGQMFADEPVYIDLAVKSWEARQGTQAVGFSPLYHDLITPFVAVAFEKEVGFIVWKFLLYYATALLMYFLVACVSRPWVGLLAAIHFNLMITPIMSGTYMMLAMAWILLSMLVLAKRPALVGVAAGIMLLGIHIRGEFSLLLAAFLALCALFLPKKLFSRQFFLQMAPSLMVFVGVIYWHGSSLQEYPKVLSLRGGFAYHHYIGRTMTEEGLLLKYTDKKWGQVDFADLDKAYQEQFGKTLTEFREKGGFNLADMYAANPDLIKLHYQKVLASSVENFREAFMVELANSTNLYSLRQMLGDLRSLYFMQIAIHLGFLIMAILPIAISRYRKTLMPEPNVAVSRVLVFAMLSPLAAIPSWYLSMPQPFYIMLLLPSVYLALILFARRFFPSMIGCDLRA